MTTPRERDSALDRWLHRSRPGTVGQTDTDLCLDAETMAAWLDGGLASPALAQAQAHAAHCVRCQALLRALSDVEAATPTHTVPATPRFAVWAPWLRSLLPMAGVAAAALAVAVWVRAPQPAGNTPRAGSVNAPVVTSAKAERAEKTSPPDGRQSDAPVAAAPAPAATEEKSLPATAPAASALRAPARRDAASAATAEVDPPASTSASEQRLADVAPMRREPGLAAPAPSAPATMNAQAAKASAAALDAASPRTAPLVVVSPDPAARWRITGARVERTRDAGVTWALADVPTADALHAGSAPSPLVCWLVGGGGRVIRTTDGSLWSIVAFPEPVDLARVAATDARTATVQTADGRRFSTADGGLTWSAP